MNAFFRSLLFLFLCLGWFSFTLFAQQRITVLNFHCSRKPIGLGDIISQRYNSKGDCLALRAAIEEELDRDERVTFIKYTDQPPTQREQQAILAERELQKNEDFIEGFVVEEWETEEADYFLSGQFNPQTELLYMQLFNRSSGALLHSSVHSVAIGFGEGTTERQRLSVQALRQLLAQFFPTRIPFVKVLERSKNKVRSILIAGGTNQGLQPKQRLRVQRLDPNTQQRTYVGEVEVEEVEGEHFSRCRVTEGGKAIQFALSEGATLSILQ